MPAMPPTSSPISMQFASAAATDRARDPLCPDHAGRQPSHRGRSCGTAVRRAVRLHPLPRRLPNHAVGLVQRARRAGRGGTAFQAAIHFRRQPTGHPRRPQSSFNPGITALTGSVTATAAPATLFGAAYTRVEAENGSYTYDHSVKTYVVSSDRHLYTTLDLSSEPAARRKVLERLLIE